MRALGAVLSSLALGLGCSGERLVQLLEPEPVPGAGGAAGASVGVGAMTGESGVGGAAGGGLVPAAGAAGAAGSGEPAGGAGGEAGLVEDEVALYTRLPDGHVTVPHAPELDFSDAFTVELYVYVRSWEGGEMLVEKWTNGLEDKALVLAAGTHLVKSWWFAGSVPIEQLLQSEQAPSLGGWQHLAVTSDGVTLRLFVDGEVVDEHPFGATPWNSDGPLYLGAALRESWHAPVDAYLSDVRISNVARYDGPFEPELQLTPDSYTVVFYGLDEGSGTQAADQGPHALHGTLGGTAEWVRAPPRGAGN